MIDFPLIIGKAVLSTFVSRLTNSLFSLEEDLLYKNIYNQISIHQTMIEDIYISSLKTFFDYISISNYEKAADALMDISNREGTPIEKYLLGVTLLKIGHNTLANKKLEEAFSANPLLLEFIGIPINSLISIPNSVKSWVTIPCTVEDSLLNKIGRRLFAKINEGVFEVEVSCFGGNIAFLESFEYKCCYGVINIENGDVIWKHTDEKDNERHIILYTPEYVVYYFHGNYELYKQSTGSCVASFSKNAFNTLFCPQNLLESVKLKPYETRFHLDDNTKSVVLQTCLNSKFVKIESFVEKEHRYWKINEYILPTIEFDTVGYYVRNVRFRLE